MGRQVTRLDNDKLERVYKFIVDYFKKYGCAPSFREISLGTDIKSISDIHGKLKRLEQAGLIKTNEWKPRTIQLIGYKCVKRGSAKENTSKSNQAKEELCSNLLISLRSKGTLSDGELQMVEEAFYSTAEGYVFVHK